MDTVKQWFLSFVVSSAIAALKQIPDLLWDMLWRWVYDAVERAEHTWITKGLGPEKREVAIEFVMSAIMARRKLNRIQQWAVRKFLGWSIDVIVEELNKSAGHGWAAQVSGLKNKARELLPTVLKNLVN